jgi:hypothetical protein
MGLDVWLFDFILAIVLVFTSFIIQIICSGSSISLKQSMTSANLTRSKVFYPFVAGIFFKKF